MSIVDINYLTGPEVMDSITMGGTKTTGNEENVKTKFALPLLELLGWDLKSKDMDLELRTTNGHTDIGLKIEGKVKVVADTKSTDKNLDNEKKQVLDDAYNRGADWALNINGNEILLYRTWISNVPTERMKPVFRCQRIDLLQKRLDGITNFEALSNFISRENIKSIERTAAPIIEEIQREIHEEDLIQILKDHKEKFSENIFNTIWKEYNKNSMFKDKIDLFLGKIGKSDDDKKNNIKKLCIETTTIISLRIMDRKMREDRGWSDKKIKEQNIREVDTRLLLKDLFLDESSGKHKSYYDSPILCNDIYFDDIPFDSEFYKLIQDLLLKLVRFDTKHMDIILGKVYEKYITKEERKELGQYYTPDIVVDFILKNMDLSKGKTIIDTCCGSGTFLIKAYDYYKAIGVNHNEILGSYINGIDIDPFATQFTTIGLMLKEDIPTDKINIVLGDSLRGILWHYTSAHDASAEILGKSYDNVVGNPAYVNLSLVKDSDKLKSLFHLAEKNYNLYMLFIELNIRMTKNGGKLGLIVPTRWLMSSAAKKLREFMLKNGKFKKIVYMPKTIFPESEIDTMIFIWQKNNATTTENLAENLDNDVNIMFLKKQEDLRNEEWKKINTIKQKIFYDNKKFDINIFLTPNYNEIISKIVKDSKKLSDIAFCRMSPYYNEKTITTDKITTIKGANNIITERNNIPILTGEDVKRYKIGLPHLFIEPNKLKKYDNKKLHIDFKKTKKILIRRVGNEIVAAIDEKGLYTKVECYWIAPVKDKSYDIRLILGILNSKMMSFYKVIAAHDTSTTFPVIRVSYLNEFPIKQPHDGKIAILVEAITNATSKSEFNKLDDQINEEVYKLYGITEEEKKIIEDALK